MGTEILKSFGTLQSELEQAKSSLKGVDENIKRLIGRDPSELPLQRQNLKRPQNNEERPRQRGVLGNSRRVYSHENDEPPNKRGRSSVFNRLSDRVPSHYEDEFDEKHKRQMISKVIVTPKEVPSRQDALDAQSKDEKSKARNRRMFGALLGTLQKFQQEETKLKSKEEKRAQVEKRIEEVEIREKAEILKERKELFFNRKKKQAEIKMIELKMNRMKEYAQWEELQKPRMHFITTKAKPHIQYLPRKLNETNRAALEESKAEIEKMIDLKRQEVFDDLQQIEERMKRNFEPRKATDVKEEENDNDEDHDHEMDAEKEEESETTGKPEKEIVNETTDNHITTPTESNPDQQNEIKDDETAEKSNINEEKVEETEVKDETTVQNEQNSEHD